MNDVPSQLVDAVANLDERACLELLRRCEGLVRAAIRQGGYFVPEIDEECLRAELRFQILSSIRSWDPGKGSLSAWVYGIARNLLNAFLRDQRALPECVSLEALGDTVARASLAASASDEEEEVASPLVAAFWEVFELMSVEEQLVIEHMIAGEPHKRLAEDLRISEEAAKMRVCRVRRRLRATLSAKVGQTRAHARR